MNDKALLELALSKVETQLAANIKALSVGRNLNVYASDVNSLIVVKANIEKLIAGLDLQKTGDTGSSKSVSKKK